MNALVVKNASLSEQAIAIVSRTHEICEGIKTDRDAKDVIGKMQIIRDLLKQADEYNAIARDFCAAECEIYIAIAKNGLTDELSASNKAVVGWLIEVGDEGQAEILRQCQEGVTVRWVYNHRDRSKDIKGQELCSILPKISDDCVQKLSEHGRVDLNDYYMRKHVWHVPGDDEDAFEECKYTKEYEFIVDAAKDRTKDKLLKAGAVGIGDGVYIDPNKYPDEVYKSVLIRAKSIYADLVKFFLFDYRVDYKALCKEVVRDDCGTYPGLAFIYMMAAHSQFKWGSFDKLTWLVDDVFKYFHPLTQNEVWEMKEREMGRCSL